MQGYEALRSGAAWIDLAQRGKIRATGEDRARLLHAMTTNHIQQLEPGQGVYAFFLTAQGRILADVNIFRLEDELLLDVEPEAATRIYEHLDKFIIADDVVVENVTEALPTVGLEGPGAEGVLKNLGAPVPPADRGFTLWGNRIVARVSQTGQLGFAIFVPAAERAELIGALEGSGAVEASSEAVTAVRLENGHARYGDDFSDKTLPQETGLMSALHFQKGCYIGQEIVERIRSRALLHRGLGHLQIATTDVPAAGTEVKQGDQKMGEITSAAFSPANGSVFAIAMIRLDVKKPGAQALTAAGAPVEVVS
ncbi:MAG: glycine cleavage T C-terminal barrel domain-containing protein [Bryobacteraceae bacterium]